LFKTGNLTFDLL